MVFKKGNQNLEKDVSDDSSLVPSSTGMWRHRLSF
jgi:hypothetical protein